MLKAGTLLGPYRIEERLGKGGMGEVYKAHDEKLNRTVAIKVLSRDAVSYPDRRRRFVQEAQTASALDHPNIVTIHDIGEAGDQHFIVMQYVKGRTLRSLIREGLELTTVLDYAIQLADGLAAAHAAGIVHRDFKPENVIVDERGRPRVLDFGLAKLTEPDDLYEADTREQVQLTREGYVLGTAAYMSPEQARGNTIDARSDIFSFGSVLYEMVSGRRAFEGDNAASVIAAVLKEVPESIEPAALDTLIRRMLEKDPTLRISSMRDVGAELVRIRSVPNLRPALRLPRWAWVAPAIVVMAAVAYVLRPATAPLPPPRLVPVTSYPGDEYYPVVAPDGSRVAFLMNEDVYVQNITGGDALQLTDTPEAEEALAWTPRSQYISFLRPTATGHEIYSVPALGGAETKIMSAAGMRGAAVGLSWSPDGTRLAFPAPGEPGEPRSLYVLHIETGKIARLTRPLAGYVGDRNPIFSPDGDAIAFIREAERAVFRDIYVMPSAGGDAVPVTSERSMIIGFDWTADGRGLVYSSDRLGEHSLYRIDLASGEPRPIEGVDGIAAWPSVFRDRPALVYEQRNADWNVWRAPGPLGEGGEPALLFGSTRLDGGPEYSPDGTKVAFQSSRSGSMEIWVCGSDGASPVRLTSLGKPAVGPPRWSPDGKRITFGGRLEDHLDVFVIDAAGGPPVQLTNDPSYDGASSWSRDGLRLYFSSDRSGSIQIWKMSADGEDPIQLTENGGVGPIESYDGRFVYYARGERGSGLWRVPSSGGGDEELVLPEGRALRWALLPGGIAFINAAEEFWFLDSRTGSRSRFGVPAGQLPPVGGGVSVSPDGRWFLYVQNDAAGDDIMMLENFR